MSEHCLLLGQAYYIYMVVALGLSERRLARTQNGHELLQMSGFIRGVEDCGLSIRMRMKGVTPGVHYNILNLLDQVIEGSGD